MQDVLKKKIQNDPKRFSHNYICPEIKTLKKRRKYGYPNKIASCQEPAHPLLGLLLVQFWFIRQTVLLWLLSLKSTFSDLLFNDDPKMYTFYCVNPSNSV